MIARTEIQRTLDSLQIRYRRARTQKEPLWFSKLAIIELCGWIEVSLDDIVLKLANRKLRDQSNIQFYRQDVVDRNYGFHYKKHFRKMLISCIGVIGVEELERNIPSNSKAILESEFGSLTTMRNSLAHTYVRGLTASIDAPSTTINRFNQIFPALQNYETAVRAL